MSLGLKLINKLTRRSKDTKKKARGFRTYDHAYKRPEILKDSPRAEQLMRKPERRMDRSFGKDGVQTQQLLAQEYIATSVGRHDYGVGDYGTQMVLPAGLEGYSASGLQVGDLVEVLQQGSPLQGQYLGVVAITDSTHVRLEDAPSLAFAGTKESTSVTTVADSSGSLNSTFWTLSTHTTNYYVWYDDGTGVDPTPGGTGVHVTYTDNASNTTIATLTKTALDAVSGAWTTVRTGAQLQVTNQAVGTATDAANGSASPGFTISVTTQGANANPTPAALTNQAVRLEESQVKKSYV